MNKNEVINFTKQYKSTVCLNSCLRPVKLVGCVEEGPKIFCVVLNESGDTHKVPSNEAIIPLKGRIKNRDYDFVEAKFNANVGKSLE